MTGLYKAFKELLGLDTRAELRSPVHPNEDYRPPFPHIRPPQMPDIGSVIEDDYIFTTKQSASDMHRHLTRRTSKATSSRSSFSSRNTSRSMRRGSLVNQKKTDSRINKSLSTIASYPSEESTSEMIRQEDFKFAPRPELERLVPHPPGPRPPPPPSSTPPL